MKKTEFLHVSTLAAMLDLSEEELLEHTKRGTGAGSAHDLRAWSVRSAAGVVRGYNVPIGVLKDLVREVEMSLPPSLKRLVR